MVTASEQIRHMLESLPCERISMDEWHRLDMIMHSQLDKHGYAAVEWWFDGARAFWEEQAK